MEKLWDLATVLFPKSCKKFPSHTCLDCLQYKYDTASERLNVDVCQVGNCMQNVMDLPGNSSNNSGSNKNN